jgi:hypothetical protein
VGFGTSEGVGVTLSYTMIPIEVVRAERAERLARIRAGRPIIPLMEGARVVVHCIPVRRDLGALNIDVGAAPTEALVPLGYRSPQRRVFDFDGALSLAPGPGGKVYGYVELRRNGVIEAVDTSLLRTTSYIPGAARFLPSAPLEGAIIVAT